LKHLRIRIHSYHSLSVEYSYYFEHIGLKFSLVGQSTIPEQNREITPVKRSRLNSLLLLVVLMVTLLAFTLTLTSLTHHAKNLKRHALSLVLLVEAVPLLRMPVARVYECVCGGGKYVLILPICNYNT
jgi:hypothetical protein